MKPEMSGHMTAKSVHLGGGQTCWGRNAFVHLFVPLRAIGSDLRNVHLGPPLSTYQSPDMSTRPPSFRGVDTGTSGHFQRREAEWLERSTLPGHGTTIVHLRRSSPTTRIRRQHTSPRRCPLSRASTVVRPRQLQKSRGQTKRQAPGAQRMQQVQSLARLRGLGRFAPRKRTSEGDGHLRDLPTDRA